MSSTDKIKFTAFDVQRAVIQRFFWKGVEFIAPNINTGFGEADLFMLRRSGYAEEFEIKVSRSDFFADRKKRYKHRTYALVLSGGIPEWGAISRVPNRFSFVVPEYLGITEKDVPEHAGLYLVSNMGRIDCCLKLPPLLHKNKNDWAMKAARSIGYKYLKLAGFFE